MAPEAAFIGHMKRRNTESLSLQTVHINLGSVYVTKMTDLKAGLDKGARLACRV